MVGCIEGIIYQGGEAISVALAEKPLESAMSLCLLARSGEGSLLLWAPDSGNSKNKWRLDLMSSDVLCDPGQVQRELLLTAQCGDRLRKMNKILC